MGSAGVSAHVEIETRRPRNKAARIRILLLPIDRRSSVVPRGLRPALRLLLPQLFLPTKHPRLIPSLLRLRHHPLALICARHRRPRQNILRLDLQNPPRRLDRPVKVFLRVVCLRQTMQRVRKFRIKRDRALILRNYLVQLPLAEEINPSVVMIFSSQWRAHRPLIAPNLIASTSVASALILPPVRTSLLRATC